jgi:phosphoribosylformylglycinamidine cyclo-ligase
MSSYLEAGVSLAEAEKFVKGISKLAAGTFNQNTLSGIGGFAGLFKLPLGYQKPVLVGCTDGVGTKLKLAYEHNQLQTIGQDLVAMCVNDLLCSGAKPLFFLDYLATENLKADQALIIAKSIADACYECGAVLLGGETAELPGMLPTNAYELAGFSVGIVEEDQILSPANTAPGDILLALPASGLHSNGYSLVRSIVKKADLDLHKTYAGFNVSLLEEILKPTTIYTKTVQPILSKVKALAHITGGGLPENLPRVFAKNLQARINKAAWNPSHIFNFLAQQGQVSEDEMFNVFNMGIGLVLIISGSEKDYICKYLNKNQQVFYEIGELISKTSVDAPNLTFEI